MGAGKTNSAINMMNNNRDKKYIFITPYLDEVKRITRSCACRDFVAPESKFDTGFKKLEHLHKLLSSGRNIASTHALFSTYTQVTIDLIKKHEYTLVLDEVLDVAVDVDIKKGDLDHLLKYHCIRTSDNRLTWTDDTYTGFQFEELMLKAKTGNLIIYKDIIAFWLFPISIFEAFSDAYILTYMFNAQVQKYYFEVNGVELDFIGVKKTAGVYHFCEVSEMTYSIDLRDKIHICEVESLNQIGDAHNALSSGWFKRANKNNKQSLTTLKNNGYVFFNYHNKAKVKDTLWTTFIKDKDAITPRGYKNGFASCNLRASNEHRAKRFVSYILNVYLIPWKRIYFQELGAKIDEDGYALSEMVQFIWRSAIRDGNDIWLYVPSSRMRKLLKKWIIEVSGEKND